LSWGPISKRENPKGPVIGEIKRKREKIYFTRKGKMFGKVMENVKVGRKDSDWTENKNNGSGGGKGKHLPLMGVGKRFSTMWKRNINNSAVQRQGKWGP